MATKRRTADLLIDHLMALSNAELHRFRKRFKLAAASSKKELRSTFTKAIKNKVLTTEAIVAFLDVVTPWGKQHVLLHRGPNDLAKKWRDSKWVHAQLVEHNLQKFVDKSVPLILPEVLSIASIEYTGSRLRVTAVRRREGWVRDHDLVKSGKTLDGRQVEYRGFVRQVLRGLVIFEWDLNSNEAMLQITQLPTSGSYEGVSAEFSKLIEHWLDLDRFDVVDIRRAIEKIRQLERVGKSDAESHALAYDRLGSRRVSMRSTSNKVPLLGDTALDNFVETIAPSSIPRIADYYWEGDGKTNGVVSAKASRTHTVIVGENKRVNFLRPSSEERMRNVLAKLRRFSR